MITRRMRRRRQALSAYVHGELEIYQQLRDENPFPEQETLGDADDAADKVAADRVSENAAGEGPPGPGSASWDEQAV
jgi:hypothetical protein